MIEKVLIFIYYVANLYLFPIKSIRHIYFIVCLKTYMLTNNIVTGWPCGVTPTLICRYFISKIVIKSHEQFKMLFNKIIQHTYMMKYWHIFMVLCVVGDSCSWFYVLLFVINFCQDYGISMSLYIQVFRLSGNCQAFPRFHAFRFSRLSGLTIVRLTSAGKILVRLRLVRLTAVRILGCQENSWQHITENYTWQ